VKSESDDLTGKKLLCERSKSINGEIAYIYTGFEFTTKENVVVHDFYTDFGRYSIDLNTWKYRTSLRTIRIFLDPEHPNYEHIKKTIPEMTKDIKVIFRDTLRLTEKNYGSMYKDGVFARQSFCILFYEDLEKHFKGLEDKNKKKLKSKQKI
jgi:hypothetical protein